MKTLHINKVEENTPWLENERVFITLSIGNALKLISLLSLLVGYAAKRQKYVAVSIDGILLEGDERKEKDTFWMGQTK